MSGTQEQAQHGLPCPQCSFLIPVTMDMLLKAAFQPIRCPNCGLQLRVDAEKSKESLDDLRKLREGIRAAEEIKAQQRNGRPA